MNREKRLEKLLLETCRKVIKVMKDHRDPLWCPQWSYDLERELAQIHDGVMNEQT